MMNPPVRRAAAVALTCEDQLLLVHRQPYLAAFPGYWSFPGGKVEPSDGPEGSDEAVMLAATRELAEETGLHLPELLADHMVESITELGEATTPAFIPTRFRTHFYRIALRGRPELTLCNQELQGARWMAAGEWLSQWQQGRLLCAPPTLAVVRALARDPAATRAPQLGRELPPPERTPWVESVGGIRLLIVRSHTIPPAQHTNCFWFGDAASPRVLVDPSPADEKEYERLIATVSEWGLDTVFITHHHPDHSERANRVARHFGATLAMSADTRARIARRNGEGWFEGIPLRLMSEGDELTRWHGEKVSVIAVPGHDAGQLAPIPESRSWCIVSDLIQSVGTVVVGGDEGDMSLYFDSLRRVIDLDPMVIFPSHGPALGGTWKLSETLRHREAREEQVASLAQDGNSVEQMLETIYAGTPAFLLPLARVNIESHLNKLRTEGRL